MNIRRTSVRAAATLLGSVLVAGISWIAVPADAASIGIVSVVGAREVVYNAAPGQANTVVLTRAGRTVTVDDVHGIKAGAGCTAVPGDATRIRCTPAEMPLRIRVDLSDGNDTLVNNGGLSSTVWGRAGNDRLTGGSRGDQVYGGEGDDTISGLGGGDQLFGEGGGDVLSGGGGDDRLSGGAGDDLFLGGGGANTCLDVKAGEPTLGC